MESVPLLLSLLILCVCGPPLYGATDYYVRPTEPTNASCPGQPCLTLHHYIQNLSSNANYHLLPGVHSINGPITLKYVHNVSTQLYLTAFYTELKCIYPMELRLHNQWFSTQLALEFMQKMFITPLLLVLEWSNLRKQESQYQRVNISTYSIHW